MGMPGEAEDSPAKAAASSLSYRHVAYLLDSERVGTANNLWLTGAMLALPRTV
jgi:hypothetical protein